MAMPAENTFKDLFCGGGGSTEGAVIGGGEPVFGVNHWDLACETYTLNHPSADALRINIRRLTDHVIKRLPHSAILIASPECRNHSVAKGAKSRKQREATLLDLLAQADPANAELPPPTADEQERSRSTMTDVARFAEMKELAGRGYLGIVVENVPDVVRWGVNNDGRHFKRWLNRIRKVGYEHEIVYLNSMFCPPVEVAGHLQAVPQSRDRVYIVFWRRGIRRPDLRVRPPSYCPRCERVVGGVQTWKKPDRPWGVYGRQYYFTCPECRSTVLPGAAPAAQCIDFSLPAEPIGGREKPLAPATLERVRRGLARLASHPFEMRLKAGREPDPKTIPLVPVSALSPNGASGGNSRDAMHLPVAGNTFERTPGNRARSAVRSPLDTLTASRERALVTANTEHAVPRDAASSPTHTLRAQGGLALVTKTGHSSANGRLSGDAEKEPALALTTSGQLALCVANRTHGLPKASDREPSQTVCTGETLAVAELQRNGGLREARDPAHTVRAGGTHHAVVVSNYSPGWTRRAAKLPLGSVTTTDGHALVVPYSTLGVSKRAAGDPCDTLTPANKLSLVVPYDRTGNPVPAELAAAPTVTTRDRLALVVPEPADGGDPGEPHRRVLTPEDITDEVLMACTFRMFTLLERAKAMAMALRPDGSAYKLLGNATQQGVMIGNAVTPPAMAFLISALLAAIDCRPEAA